MSSTKFDRHSLCSRCRESKRDLDHRCAECVSWTKQEFDDYLKHRKSLESKSRKSIDTSSASTSSDSELKPEKSSEVKAQNTPDMESLFLLWAAKYKTNLAQDVPNINPSSLTAPSLVPDMHTVSTVGAGGEAPSS